MKTKRERNALLIAVLVLTVTTLMLGSMLKDAYADLMVGEDTQVTLDMSTLSVSLKENGAAVAEGDGLFGGDGVFDDAVDPGYLYDEVIAAGNPSDTDVYVRMIVKKYWVDAATGEKIQTLDPARIRLCTEDGAYNTADWFLNEEESTVEQSVYYCRQALAAGEETSALFTAVGIDKAVAADYTLNENGSTVTAVYAYDGATFCIDIEVQAVQAEHGAEAVRGAWGVPNVTVRGGSLVKE